MDPCVFRYSFEKVHLENVFGTFSKYGHAYLTPNAYLVYFNTSKTMSLFAVIVKPLRILYYGIENRYHTKSVKIMNDSLNFDGIKYCDHKILD